jgi:hypothetical protein
MLDGWPYWLTGVGVLLTSISASALKLLFC